MITVHPGHRKPTNGCMAEAGDGLCPYVATHKVTIRTVDGPPMHTAVCGVHELVLRDEGRLAGSAPIVGAR